MIFRATPLLLALVTLLGASCASSTEPIPPFPGRSTRAPGGPTAAPASSARPPERWDRWAELGSWRVAVVRTPSQHLAADHEAETLASPEAAAYPDLGPARPLGPGAALVQRLYAPGAASPELVLAMVRRPEGASTEGTNPSGWEYLVLDPGGLVTERGPIAPCARCHAEAPHEGLFGRAR